MPYKRIMLDARRVGKYHRNERPLAFREDEGVNPDFSNDSGQEPLLREPTYATLVT